MIRKTRNQPSTRKDFDAFLLYGYSAVAIAVMAWLAIRLTGNMRFMLIWFAMFLPYLWMSLTAKAESRRSQHISTACSQTSGKSSAACSDSP